MNLRILINSKKDNFAKNEDKDVLSKYNSLLRTYHESFSKSYSDHTDVFNKFLDLELRDLVLSISKHSSLSTNIQVKELRELIE
jgi:hypothetical protein